MAIAGKHLSVNEESEKLRITERGLHAGISNRSRRIYRTTCC